MQTSMNWIVSDSGTVTVFANGKSYSFAKDHQFYTEAKEALHKSNLDEIVKLHDMSKTIVDFADGNVEVKDGVVIYKGKALREKFSRRIMDLMIQKLPFLPMLNFLENLMENPSMRSVDQLYDFLSHRALPITDDGHFLAYKRVDNEWKDLHSHAIDNSVGQVVKMPRNEVDDERSVGCGAGLHAGSIEYVKGYCSGGHVIVVKINPRDVVSVPSESNCTKMRCCEYLVVDEYKEDLVDPVYAGDGSAYPPEDEDESAILAEMRHEDDDEEEDDDEDEEEDWEDREESQGW